MVKNNAVNSINPVVQVVYASLTTYLASTTRIPSDNSIPQSGEGVEILTLTITPKSITNILVIEFSTMIQQKQNGDACTIALFQDAGAGALVASLAEGINLNDVSCPYLRYVMPAATVAATTFKVRFGPNVGGNTVGVNGTIAGAGSRLFNGTAATFFIIKELYA